MTRILGLFAIVALFLPPAWGQTFEYAVRHRHLLKDCRGTLIFSHKGVEYRASKSKDARMWEYDRIRVIELRSPTEVSICSYEDQKRYLGKDRDFEFRLENGRIPESLSAFLLSKVGRPMVLAVFPEEGKPVFEVPVKHLRTLTGSHGVLRIYPDRVIYKSEMEGDSRFWRLSDIERLSQPDRFRLQIVSHVPMTGGPTEVYNFQLLNDLPDQLYDYVWLRLHPSSYYPLVQR